MGIAFALNNILPEVCHAGGARSVELCLCDITFQAMMILLISIYFNLSFPRHEFTMHSLRNFNNECSSMCVSIGFNETFDYGKDKGCVFVKEF